MDELLVNKSYSEKANLKADEVCKHDLTGKYEDKTTGITLEIAECEKIENGVQVFARAWKNGEQLGFGDGSVDIERFRIFNPPLLVDDENGDIVGEKLDADGKKVERRMRLDPAQAIKEALAHTVLVSGKVDTKIEAGKVGNTTSTFYPNSGGTSPADARAYHGGAWATIRTAATGTSVDIGATNTSFGASKWGAGANDFDLYRSIYCFDTSSIPDTDTISAATLSVYKDTNAVRNTNTTTAHICGYTGNTGSFTTGDYGILNYGSTSFGSIAFSSIGTDAYNDFTLDANGRANVSKTGISGFGGRNSIDLLDGTAPTGNNDISVYFANETGTAKDPKLVVEHAASASGPVNLKSLNTNLKANIKSYNTNLIANSKSINTNV